MIFRIVIRIVLNLDPFGRRLENVRHFHQERADVQTPLTRKINRTAALEKTEDVHGKIKCPKQTGKLGLDAATLLLRRLLPIAGAEIQGS